jgi:hypothetical protein
MDEKIVEAVGYAVYRQGLQAKALVPEITRIVVTKRDKDGNVIQEVAQEFKHGDDR